ncbi:MAG: hypothetical protein K2X81_01305, partial [Candidatus Obscuribacterales bacterium]|nr:hypothetical protein [Candidatus Obscuribacterales bacterium]
FVEAGQASGRAYLSDLEWAIEYAMHGGLGIGIDTKTVNNILENRSESERRMITRLWNETHSVEYGFGLREAFADKMNGSTLQKTLNLLDKPDNKLDFAGEIRFSLLDRGQWFGERKSAVDEKSVRESLAKMTAADIRSADASYKQRFDGDGMISEIMSDSNLSSATKEAAKIYLKGADNRTDEDTLQLAQIALKAADVEMFGEAWAGASQDARDRFMAKGGQEQMQNAFGGSYWNILTLGLTGNISDKDLRRTTDYQAFGKLSVATETRENTTWLGDNITAIEKSLADMTDKERALYERGRTLTHYDLQDAKKGDGEARAYYKKTHAALERAAGWWFSPASSVAQLAKWDDMARTKGGGVISRIAENRGYVWNSSTESLMSSIENMSKSDILRLKTDPAFRKDLDNTIDTMWGLVAGQSIAEVKRAHDLVKRKAEAEADTESYTAEQRKMYNEGRDIVVSGHNMEHASAEDLKAFVFYISKVTESANANQRRDVMSALNDNVSWYHNNEDKVYEALTNMTRSEIANYKNNTDGFRDKLDEHLKSVLSSGAYKVASTMLQGALKGEQPKTDILQKLEYRATCWTSDNGKVVRDLLSAFHEDPKLQERIAHPQNAEDKALSDHFHDAAKRAMGSRVYADIGEKLLDTGKIDLGAQLELSFGHIYPYQTLYSDAAAASAQDRAALLKSTNDMSTAFMILGEDERQILTNVLKQGEVRPEDKLRGYVTGLGASKAEIQQLFGELKDRDKMAEELSKRPELKNKNISEEMISTAINARLNDVRTAYAQKYNESLSERLSYELGGDAWVQTRRLSQSEALTGSEVLQRAQNEHYDTKGTMSGIMNWVGWDGTSAMADSRNLQVEDLQIKSAASGKEIPMEDARNLAENILTAVDNRAKSESSLIDSGVDAAITAATIALLLPSGGSSLSMMALTRFPMLARGIATVAEVTKGLAQAARVEALATYLQSASRITQLTVAGLAGGSTKLGAHVALNSRFDIASEGATKFTEGFVSTVGQLVGAKDVAALQGLFRESGEKAAAKLSAEFLEQGGKAIVNAEAKQQAIHGMTDIIRTSLAAGTDNIDKKLVTDL